MLALNQLIAISVRLLTPWQGAWIADVDVELDATQSMPSGRVVLTIGTNALVGTVDANASGRFTSHAKVRVVAGGNGWQQITKQQHFTNDGGVINSAVIAAVAAEVGETAVVATQASLGTSWVKMAGPAYRAMRGLAWYVDFNGITQVAPRAPAPAPADVEVLEWDGLWQTAQIASDSLLVPGMVITDTRFGSITVRDVEQVFATNGARSTAWCGPATKNRLGAAFATLAREATGIVYARSYKYRVVLQNPDGRLVLQAVTPTLGIPDALPISVWYGLPGAQGKPALGSECILEFNEGDPAQPMVRAFDGAMPLEIDFVAEARFSVNAPDIELGTAPEPLAKGAETVSAIGVIAIFVAAVATAQGALDTAWGGAPTVTTLKTFVDAIGSAAATLATDLPPALAAVPTLEVKGT